jgi:hypothetical protein
MIKEGWIMIEGVFSYLRENHLVILGIIATVAAVVYQIKKTRRSKSLSYFVRSKTKLLTLHDENVGKLEIVFDGQPVLDAHIFVIEIRNTGNIPIISSDFEKPIEIVFAKKAEILSVAIVERVPENLVLTFSFSEGSTQINPTLLNPNESFTLKFLLRDNSNDPEVSARIVGISEIRKTEFRSDEERARIRGLLIANLVLLAMAGALLYFMNNAGKLEGLSGFLQILGAGLGASSAITAIRGFSLARQNRSFTSYIRSRDNR